MKNVGMGLLVLFAFYGCKVRDSNSDLMAESQIESALATVDSFATRLADFRKQVETRYITGTVIGHDPLFLNNPIKLSEVIKVEEGFDVVLDKLSQAQFDLGADLKSRLLDQQRQLVKTIFPAASFDLRPAESMWNVFEAAAWKRPNRAVENGFNSSFIQDCGKIYAEKMTSRKQFLELVSFEFEGVSSDYRKIDPNSSLLYFVASEERRQIVWNLAGRPMDADQRDYPEELKWASGSVFSTVDNTLNLDKIHQWYVEHCPQIARSIDEMVIERGSSAFPTLYFGSTDTKYIYGYTRRLTKEKVAARLAAMAELIDLVRQSLNSAKE